jgi:hypothetical protein
MVVCNVDFMGRSPRCSNSAPTARLCRPFASMLSIFSTCTAPLRGHQPVDKLDDLDTVDGLFLGLAVHRATVEAIRVSCGPAGRRPICPICPISSGHDSEQPQDYNRTGRIFLSRTSGLSGAAEAFPVVAWWVNENPPKFFGVLQQGRAERELSSSVPVIRDSVPLSYTLPVVAAGVLQRPLFARRPQYVGRQRVVDSRQIWNVDCKGKDALHRAPMLYGGETGRV